MRSLEELIRPPSVANDRMADLLGAIMIIALTAILLRTSQISEQRYFNDVIAQMFSFYLLAALGFALALRCGAIDLSVWAVGALGGAVAVSVFHMGGGGGSALLAGCLTGALIGAINGAFVAYLRVPSVIITLITGAAIVLSLRILHETRSVSTPEGAFEPWLELLPQIATKNAMPIMISGPLILRILLVVATYVVTALVLVVILRVRHLKWIRVNPRGEMLAALCASGALAGLAGAIWLIDHKSSPIPRQLIGDLRIPAAAILAGAGFFGGKARTLLVMLCLPATLLLSTLWGLHGIHLPFGGYSPDMLLLIVMTVGVHLGFFQTLATTRRAKLLAALSVALTMGGFILLSGSAGSQTYTIRSLFHTAGTGIWAIGIVLLVISRTVGRKKAEASVL